MSKTRRFYFGLASLSVAALAFGSGPVFANSWGSSGGGSSGGGPAAAVQRRRLFQEAPRRRRVQRRLDGRFPSPRRRRIQRRRVQRRLAWAVSCTTAAADPAVGPAAVASSRSTAAAAPAAAHWAASCTTAAADPAAADPAAAPTESARLPTLARRTVGNCLPPRARLPVQAGKEAWKRPSRPLLTIPVPADGRCLRDVSKSIRNSPCADRRLPGLLLVARGDAGICAGRIAGSSFTWRHRLAPAAMEPSSDLRSIHDACRPYLEVLYLDHGYHFFAPEPEESTLLAYEAERPDGTVVRGRIPDRATQPRLLYHRYFMLTEHMKDLRGTPPLWYESYAQHIGREYGAAQVRLIKQTHLLPAMERIREGGRLGDPESYEDHPLGNFHATVIKPDRRLNLANSARSIADDWNAFWFRPADPTLLGADPRS